MMQMIRLRRGAISVFTAAALGATAALTSVPAEARSVPDSFADLAERLSPAVVNISTSQTVDRPSFGPGQGLPEGSPFEDFFRDFFDQRNGPQQPRKVQSLGSGFVIDPDGYIVTNNHVIEDADEIVANFPNGDSFDAEIIGRDPKTDIALLKLTEMPDAPLPTVKFGDSDAARVGDWVVAIGNPFGLGGTVTAGIISARNRDINAGPYDDFLQTDAAINRGNSGGPLFNMDGDVIGVNTAIFSPTGGSVGVGFAVPSDIVTNVVAQLREFGETRRGWIGVRIRGLDEELAEGLGLEEPKGALVEGVTEDGPAGKAGVEVGDVILNFNGIDIDTVRDLPRAVAETPVGETVRIVVWRKDQTVTLRAEVGLFDEGGTSSASSDKPEEDAKPETSALGLVMENLTGKKREQYSIDPEVEGVLVAEVAPTGPAAEKGLRPGDVILEVGQETVTDPEAAMAAIKSAEDSGRSSVLFLVKRGEDQRFIAIRFPEKEEDDGE